MVTLIGLALLAGGVLALVPPLVTQTGELIDNIPDYIQSLQRNETINDLVQRYDIVNKVQGAINASTVGNTLGGVVGAAGLIFGTLFNVLTVLVLTIYFMAAFERIKSGAYRLVPAVPPGAGQRCSPTRSSPRSARTWSGRWRSRSWPA